MRINFFIALLGFIFLPLFVSAAGGDLRVDAADIRFSKTTLIVGDQVRLYARIYNIGTTDVRGYLTFFQGNVAIEEPQVISIVANSNPEEVFVDFIIPQGSFNIRAVISGTIPEDISLLNNVAISTMFVSVLDDDRDGVVNASDNCVAISNLNQGNADQDEMGDACDEDDDNDGLTDSIEAELGSNSLVKDSDGDGVEDAKDAFPNDSTKTVVQKPVVSKPKPVTAPPEPKSEPLKQEKQEPIQREKEQKTIPIFTQTQKNWNTSTFSVSTPRDERVVYEWNFGDGVTSSKTEITHTFSQPGEYLVTLKITDADGSATQESVTFYVPFFSLLNPFVRFLIVILILLCVFGVAVFVSFRPSTHAWLVSRFAKKSSGITHIHIKEEEE